MGYRKYAKDYEIEYTDRLGQKRPKAVRIYVGPYYVFSASAAQLRKLKARFTLGLVILGAAILAPLCMNTPAARTWYIQVPLAMGLIPWFFSLCALWRLWTAKDRVEREHYDMLYGRMSGSLVGMLAFCGLSLLGCLWLLLRNGMGDGLLPVLLCDVISLAVGLFLMRCRKGLEMREVENPEKPQAGK